jgi:hypothetical protein
LREALMKLSLLVSVGISLLLAATILASAPLVNGQTPDFNITADPSGQCIALGSSATYHITVSSTGGFSGQVQLEDSVVPSVNNGPSLSSIPSTVNVTPSQPATFDLTASTTSSTPSQVYTVTIDALAGTNVHSATAQLAFSPDCGTVGGVSAPVNGLSLAAPFIGIAAIFLVVAGAVAVAVVRFRPRGTLHGRPIAAA